MENHISSVIKNKKNTNVNVTKGVNTNVKRYNVNAERTARLLSEKLNDPESFLFYCKVAHQLPENLIWSNLEQAKTGKNPRAYFTFLCKLKMPVDKVVDNNN